MKNLDTDEREDKPDAPAMKRPSPRDYAPETAREPPKPERAGFYRGARIKKG